MLGKLLKYEIKATGRIFLPLYLGLVAVAVISSFTLQSEYEILNGVTAFLLVMLYGALIIVTVALLIQRFYRNLLRDEGYLMFTLPVRQATLVASKLLTACLWSFLSSVVGAAAGMIAARSFFTLNDVAALWGKAAAFFSDNSIPALLVVISVAACAMQFIQSVLQIYLSLSIGQLPAFCKHRVLSSVVAFVLISLAVQIIASVALSGMAPAFMELATSFEDGFEIAYGQSEFLYQLPLVTAEVMWMALAINAILAAAMFAGTTWILQRKLNLD